MRYFDETRVWVKEQAVRHPSKKKVVLIPKMWKAYLMSQELHRVMYRSSQIIAVPELMSKTMKKESRIYHGTTGLLNYDIVNLTSQSSPSPFMWYSCRSLKDETNSFLCKLTYTIYNLQKETKTKLLEGGAKNRWESREIQSKSLLQMLEKHRDEHYITLDLSLDQLKELPDLSNVFILSEDGTRMFIPFDALTFHQKPYNDRVFRSSSFITDIATYNFDRWDMTKLMFASTEEVAKHYISEAGKSGGFILTFETTKDLKFIDLSQPQVVQYLREMSSDDFVGRLTKAFTNTEDGRNSLFENDLSVSMEICEQFGKEFAGFYYNADNFPEEYMICNPDACLEKIKCSEKILI